MRITDDAKRGLWVLLCLGLLWTGATASGWISPLYLPGPSDVARAFSMLFRTGYAHVSLAEDVSATFSRLLLAFALVGLSGIPLGIVIGRVDSLAALVLPLIQFYRPIPAIAYLPLFIAWLGIGFTSKVVLLYVLGIPLVIIPVAQAARDTRPERIEGARSLGATPLQVFCYVIFPSCLPDILSSLRLTLITMFSGLIAAEIVGATSGLGWLIWSAAGYFQTPIVIAGILTMAVLGVIGERILRFAQIKITPWVGH